MNENFKSGIVLVIALLLGALVVAGLVLQLNPNHEEQRTGQPILSTQSEVQYQTEPVHTENPNNTISVPPSVPPVPEQKPTLPLVSETGHKDVPLVDFFGKPLDEFARQVIERVGIAGRVVMAGRPVPGATVRMRRVSKKIVDGAPDYTGVTADPPGGQEWTTTTDAEGRYAFYELDDGHFGLEAYTETACGVDDMTIRDGSIPGRFPGKPAYFAGRSQMSIELWPSGTMSGHILTKEGQPIAGATIYPYQIQYPTGTLKVEPVPQVMLSVRSVEDGFFQFPRLPAGRWQLAVRAMGYVDQMTDWLSTNSQPVDIRLNNPQNAVAPGEHALDSAVFNLSEYKGKYVLLDFWATWCSPCRAEMPNIKAVHEEFKDNPRFVVVGMDLDGDPEIAKKYIAEKGLGWSHVFLGDWSNSGVAKKYHVEAIPCLILLDPDGRELARDLRGPIVREAVQKALRVARQSEMTETPKPIETNTLTTVNNSPATVESPASREIVPSNGILRLNIDRDFTYSSDGFPMGLSAWQTDAPPLTEHPCKILTAEPKYHCKEVYYGYLKLGNAEDNRFVFAVDDHDKSTWIGYFDRNNNGDLTDDGPPVIISANVEFDVSVVLPTGQNVHRLYRIWQWGNSEAGKPGLRFYSVCHYQTMVNINGKKISAVAFERSNHDALYHDDGIWLDLNGDGRMDEKDECFKAESTFMVDGQSFQVKLDYP